AFSPSLVAMLCASAANRQSLGAPYHSATRTLPGANRSSGQFRTCSRLVCVAICGLAGMGKSSIARARVDIIGPDYAGVWWVNAQRRQGLTSGLAALAVRYEAALQSEADIEKLARAALARIERSERPLLLIFDNVESPEAVDKFLPARGAH